MGREVGDFRGRVKATKWWSATVRGVTETAAMAQNHVKARSSWFPGLWVDWNVAKSL